MIADEVDRFLAAEKSLTGGLSWKGGTRDGELRARFPIVHERVVSNAVLEIDVYTSAPHYQFAILLLYPPAVQRLDFEPVGGHTNPPDAGCEELIVRGPHVHLWSDNRRYATAAALPKELEIARSLQPQIRQLEQAFRWFCAEINVSFDETQIPNFPTRDTLL